VSDSGHLGAAKLFGPTVCLKCTATHSTPAHRCCCLLGCENRWSLPCPPRGIGPLCTLVVIGPWPMTTRRFSLVGTFLRGSVRGLS
jgi:hypothetical protein